VKLTIPGRDYVIIDEMSNNKNSTKIHLIKLLFKNPTEDRVLDVLENNQNTKRYVVEDNIKLYNSIFKYQNKKYYVENRPNIGLVSFFKKNNKNLLNILNLNNVERTFIFDNLSDVLRNLEVIQMKHEDFRKFESILDSWNGNVIIDDPQNM
jgi:hypothetical protein